MRLLLAMLILILLAFPAHADITGKPRIIDGDTIEVAGERIRLHGIDAPESNQTCEWPSKTIPCGRLATLALMDLMAGAEVTCKTRGKDRYGRWVAVCYDPDGFDIGKNMVHTGWALAYRQYSTDYVDTEDKARETKRGMWKGEFASPWEWRRGVRSSRVKTGVSTYTVYRDNRPVLRVIDRPGTLTSTALLPAGATPVSHPFLTANALAPEEEDQLRRILDASNSIDEFL
ncbi:MAG: thermonuclease family protein, partial [Proteobacteria bacterium]|nr:thermonuclease family protein [Pseudomonadota bacterium]